MTQETQIKKNILAMGLFEALDALYAMSTPPNSAVAAVVEGYMVAFREQVGEEAAPVEPKQRRARRQKSDMATLAAEAINA